MRALCFKTIIIALLAAVIICPASASELDVKIENIDRSEYPQVKLDVSVFDAATGEAIRGLRENAFTVTAETEVFPMDVRAHEIPLSVCLVLDKSGSMRDAMPDLRVAASAFMDILGVKDETMVLVFDRTWKVLQDFSVEKERVKTALYSFHARGATALYDTLFYAVQETSTRPNKQVIVIMTDGKDQTNDGSPPLSKHTAFEVVEFASSADIPIYTIGLGSNIDRDVLREMSRSTGGQFFYSPTSKELKAMYEKVARSIKTYYQLTYTTPFNTTAVKPRKLSLEVDTPEGIGNDEAVYRAGDGVEMQAYMPNKLKSTPFTGERAVNIEVRDRFGNPIEGSFQLLMNGQVVENGQIHRGSAALTIRDELVKKQFEPKRISFERKPLAKRITIPSTNRIRLFTTWAADQHVELVCEMAPVSNPLDRHVFTTTADGVGNTSWTSDIVPGDYLIWLKHAGRIVLTDEQTVPRNKRAIVRYKFGRVVITINGRELKDFEKMGMNMKIYEKTAGRDIFSGEKLYHFVGPDSAGVLPQGNYVLELSDASSFDVITLKKPMIFECVVLGGEEILADISLDDLEYHRIGP